MTSALSKTLGTACLAMLLIGGPARADMAGDAEFQHYCAGCHGRDGTGTGPLAELLNTQVADLTTITQRNTDKVFPFLEVMHVIDGRSGLRAHGSEMPLWGDRFSAEAEADHSMAGDYRAVYEVRGRVLSLVYFLQSIQK